MREALSDALDLIHRENSGWLQFFCERDIQPIEVTSDEVNQRYPALFQKIASVMNIVIDRTKLELMAATDHPYEGQRTLKQDLFCMLRKAFGL